jgi:hypothetical protein
VDGQEERCIPWDPIPHEYNRASDLGITNFGEVGVETVDGVVCIVHSSSPADGPERDTTRRDHRWRIFFEGTRAFRLRPVIFGEWPEALPITLPPKSWSISGNRRVALWEIASSVYVAQSIDPGDRDEARHYVLLNHDMAYEVVAFGYRVEDLGEYQRPLRS